MVKVQEQQHIYEIQLTILNQEIKKLYIELAHTQKLSAEYHIALEAERLKRKELLSALSDITVNIRTLIDRKESALKNDLTHDYTDPLFALIQDLEKLLQ